MQSDGLRTLLIIFVLTTILGGVALGVKTKNRMDAERRDYEFDTARNVFKATVENPEFYMDTDNPYVKSVEAELIYDDSNWSSYVYKQSNEEHVTVYLDSEIDSFEELQKCETFIPIAEDYIKKLENAYKNSRYVAIFNENKIAYRMDYKDKEVEIDHYCVLENFTFKTENRTYSLNYKYRTDGRYLLTDTINDLDKAEFYVFYYYGDEIKDFEKESVLKARLNASKNSGSSKKSSSSGSGTSKSSGTAKSKSGKSKTYDSYNVHDYKSAQDFADDKYEEFYDYEDDYDDEDEAYDAAEDYWNDNY